jgi:hypothetical protein
LNLFNAGVTVLVQVVTAVLLIPRMGVTGAALSMCIGFTVQGLLRFLELRSVFGWSWPWPTLRRPIAAFGLAMLPSALMRLTLGASWEVPAGILFLALYAGSWRWLGAEPADREIWQRLRSRKLLDSTEPLTPQ